jgi:hypothetical protein
MNKCIFLLIFLGACFISSVYAAEPNKKDKTLESKWVRWFHFNMPAKDSSDDLFQTLRQVKELGYKGVIINLWGRVRYKCGAGNNEYSYKEITDMISYIKNDLGMEVIPEIKLLGKSNITYGRLAGTKPDIFIAPAVAWQSVLDPLKKIGSKTAYDIYVTPLIDELIELFQQPAYFHLGYDEIYTDVLQKIAEKHGVQAGDIWAGTLNKAVEHLVSKNITPLMWGDMLVSKKLAGPDNPLGYPGDPGFNTFGPLNSVYPKFAKTDILASVKNIKNKDKIIICDWHYGRGNENKEYPSIPYFKWLGFKGIIACPWFAHDNIKAFLDYAKKNNCQGVMLTTWGYLSAPAMRDKIRQAIGNTGHFDNNPGADIPVGPSIVFLQNKKEVISAASGSTVEISLSQPRDLKDLKLSIHPSKYMFKKKIVTFKPKANNNITWQIPDDLSGFIDVIATGKNNKNAFFHNKRRNALYINNGTFKKEFSDCLFGADFSKDQISSDGKFIVLRGKSDIAFALKFIQAQITKEGLVCSKNGGLRIPESESDGALEEFSVMVDFMLKKMPEPGKDNLACLFAWGTWGKGVRLFVNPEGEIWSQVGFGPSNKDVYSNAETVKPGKRYTLIVTVGKGKITQYINGKKVASANYKRPPNKPMSYPGSIGFIFQNHGQTIGEQPQGLKYAMDGIIYKFGVWDKVITNPELLGGRL